MNNDKKKITRRVIISSIAILLIVVVVLLIIKYQVEGETNMPFNLGKIMIISTAEGVSVDEPEAMWDLNIVQNNDIYIQIDKNKNYNTTEIISKITLDNFKINKTPQNGIIKVYRPSNDEKKTYVHNEQYEIKESLEYSGNTESNIKNLQIANQGGMILLRYSIEDLGKYVSSEETEVRHDGTFLSKVGVSKKEIESEVSFDITISLVSGINYKGTVILNIPSGNLVEEGTSSKEITNLKNVVFKRC